jgi:hypothetical protein
MDAFDLDICLQTWRLSWKASSSGGSQLAAACAEQVL